jgi:hypothetical protein
MGMVYKKCIVNYPAHRAGLQGLKRRSQSFGLTQRNKRKKA